MMNAHPQYEEDFDLYELGVLDGDDQAGMESHLAGCGECRARREAARSRAARLALAAPLLEPPATARKRVIETFRLSRAESVSGKPLPASGRRSWVPAGSWAWALACLLLLCVAGGLAVHDERLSRRLIESESAQRELVLSNLHLQAEGARTQSIVDLLLGPKSVQVELSPASAPPVPHGKAFYNREKGLLLYTTNLHSLPANRTYELWLIPTAGKPVDVGIFNTDAQGNGHLIQISLPQGLTAKAFAVTVEPAGGVPAPTGSMVLVGPVS
jgi:anti-sigma-K factor RskA